MHDYVTTQKRFLYHPFRSLDDSPIKGQCCGALVFFSSAWTVCWINNWVAGYLKRQCCGVFYHTLGGRFRCPIRCCWCNVVIIGRTGVLGTAVRKPHGKRWVHYDDVIMSRMASQITCLTIVYSTVYSDAIQRKHQSSASLAIVWGIHRDRWIPRTKGQ